MDRNEGRYSWRWSLARLLRGLESERCCSSSALTACWLIDHLSSWNEALRVHWLALTEFEPGKLRLRSDDSRDDYVASYCSGGSPNDGSFLMAWLPRQHQCIREIWVSNETHLKRLSFISSSISGRAPNLQCVRLHPCIMLLAERAFLEAFGPPQYLAHLNLTNIAISDGFAAIVAEVLRRNSRTLQSVSLIGNGLSLKSAGTLFLALVTCERLTNISFQDSSDFSACDIMTEFFRSARFIERISLVALCSAGTRCKHFVNSHNVCPHCLRDLFAALEGLLLFQHLALEATSIGNTMGDALAKLLRHHALKTLSLSKCSYDNRGTLHIANAISANCRLEQINMQNSFPEAEIVSNLCGALASNTALRSVVLPEISSTSPIFEKENPTLRLLTAECPGRVEFSLLLQYPSIPSSTLKQAIGCATTIKIMHSGFSENTLYSVYESLALNHSLKSLYIAWMNGGNDNEDNSPETLINVICSTLKVCRRLQTFQFEVHMVDKNEEVALVEILGALQQNKCLRKLLLGTSRMTLRTAQSLSALVALCNRTMVDLYIFSEDTSDAVLRVLHDMITENVFLSRITLGCHTWKGNAQASAALDDAKEHNQGLLNKAARFVMSFESAASFHHCAAAFDELSGTAVLREHLVALSGKSELQVSFDVNRARCYLQEKYFVLTGVVYKAVVCEAGDGSMQLDGLNANCWRAISQYLKLSDVIT